MPPENTFLKISDRDDGWEDETRNIISLRSVMSGPWIGIVLVLFLCSFPQSLKTSTSLPLCINLHFHRIDNKLNKNQQAKELIRFYI